MASSKERMKKDLSKPEDIGDEQMRAAAGEPARVRCIHSKLMMR